MINCDSSHIPFLQIILTSIINLDESKMTNNHNSESIFHTQQVTWNEVSNKVRKVNPALADICDKVTLDKDLPLFLMRYPYGANIINQETLHVPYHGAMFPLNHQQIPAHFKAQLSYSLIPFSLILHNNSEVYVNKDDIDIPFNLLESGEVFGVFETVSLLSQKNALVTKKSYRPWNVSAGARSVFMIPKISDSTKHIRLKKALRLSQTSVPLELSDQWQVFKEINSCYANANPWYNEILVFGNHWFERRDDLAWKNFKEYISDVFAEQADILTDHVSYDIIWSSFTKKINNLNLKARPYLIDTAKNLLSLANGNGIAFKPATDEKSLPVTNIQDAYLTHYKLNSYIPTIMEPCQSNKTKMFYYSLSYPMLVGSDPAVRNPPSILEDERRVEELIKALISTIKQDTNLKHLLENIRFDFYHFDPDDHHIVQHSSALAQEDNRFLHSSVPMESERRFCETGLFFRGCIRITIDTNN